MNSNKIVIIDIHYLYVAQTGIKTYIQELLRVISSYNSVEMSFLVFPDIKKVKSNNFFKKGTFLSALLFHIDTFWWKHILLPFLALKYNADAIVYPDYYASFWKMKAQKIVIFHDAFFWENPHHYNKYWLRYFKFISITCLRGLSKVITVSNESASQLKKYEPSLQNVKVIHSIGPSLQKKFIDDQLLEKFDLQKEKFFLHVGVLEKRKNLTTIIKAIRDLIINDNFNDIKLVLVGIRGPKSKLDDYDNIKKTITESGLEEKVVLTGYLPKSELAVLYSNAFAYLFPSKSEGFGFPILEALSYQLPVITSENRALTEIGGNAILIAKTEDEVDWADKMKCLLKDNSKRVKLIESGIKKIEEFSDEKFIKKFEEIILY